MRKRIVNNISKIEQSRMARQKGTPKTGGRKAGTPNKVTGTLKEFIADLIDSNREQIEKDLKRLAPKDRLYILEKFVQYVIPKTQSMQADINGNAFEELMKSLPDDE